MKFPYPKIPPSLLVSVLVLANPSVLPGQIVSEIAPPKGESAAIVLSPFVVDTAKDTGFVAATSLAGGRLATDLADTPAAYSVLTREFIDALNITDLAGAIEWTVNTNASTDN